MGLGARFLRGAQMSLVCDVCFRVEFSASGWPFVQWSPTECVSEGGREASIIGRLLPTRSSCAIGKNYKSQFFSLHVIFQSPFLVAHIQIRLFLHYLAVCIITSVKETIWHVFFLFMFCRRSPGGVCSLRESVPRLFEPSGSRFLRLVLHGQPGPAAHQGVLSIFLEIVWRFRQRGVLHHRNWKGRRGQSPGVDCWNMAQGVILFSADRSGGCSLCAGKTRVWLAEWSLSNSVHRKGLLCH